MVALSHFGNAAVTNKNVDKLAKVISDALVNAHLKDEAHALEAAEKARMKLETDHDEVLADEDRNEKRGKASAMEGLADLLQLTVDKIHLQTLAMKANSDEGDADEDEIDQKGAKASNKKRGGNWCLWGC